jgi:Cytochrome c552
MSDSTGAQPGKTRRLLLLVAAPLLPLIAVGGWLGWLVVTGEAREAEVVVAPLPEPEPPRDPLPSPRADYSNIHLADYVGPAVCGECHEEQYALWQTHPHSRMNQDASADTVLGDFSGVSVDYAGGQARFTRDGQDYLVSLQEGDVLRRYRVTRTVGSRFAQMYIGVLIEGPEPAGHPSYTTEGKLPFGYWLRLERWFPEVYFDSDCPPEYRADGSLSLPVAGTHERAAWGENCMWCHNTYPYEERLRAGRGMPGFPADDLRLVDVEPDDPEPAGTTPAAPALVPEQLVTLGISCESCHFGGREHADEGRDLLFLPQSPRLDFPAASPELVAGAREDAYAINSICAQCHGSRGVSTYPDGSGTWNAREALDLLAGACGPAKCTDCHEPHTPSAPGGGPDNPEHVAACLGCHQRYSKPEARATHTRHGPDVSCLDCHMPRIVQGLDTVIRSHKISSPTDPRMLAEGYPNACNLCHLDRTLAWTLAGLSTGWDRRVELAGMGQALAFQAPMGQVYLEHDRPSVRLVATDAHARAGLLTLQFLAVLDDPYAVNRMFAQRSLERLLERRLDPGVYDPLAPPADRKEQVRRLAVDLLQ